MVTQQFDVVRSEVFNFHSIRLVLIAQLKIKAVRKWRCVNLNLMQEVMEN